MERRNRAGGLASFVLVAAAAGALTGLAAATGLGPFASLRPAPRLELAGQRPPYRSLEASLLFPAPSPAVIHKQVDVYDPSRAAPAPPPGAPASAPPPASAPSPAATPSPAPTPTDDGGVGDP